MKTKISAAGLLLLTTALFSCKNKTAFTISGTVKNGPNTNLIYLQAADSTGQYKTIDSVKLSDHGDFQFTRQSAYANLYRLRADTTQFDLAAENGDNIDFGTDLSDKQHAYSISGSDASAQIKQFNATTKEFTDRSNKVVAEFQAKARQSHENPDSLLSIYMPVFQKNLAEYSEHVLQFINTNKGSLAAFYASNALDPAKYEPQLISYADDISTELRKNPLVAVFVRAENKAKPLAIGHQAPEFTISDNNGKPIKLSDYRGKYVMLDFWASWCVPCRQENPNVVKQYQAFHQKGFNVLGISLDKDKSAWQKAVSDDHLTWTQTSDLNSFQGAVEELYNIQAIPSNFIVNPQGVIIAKNVRGLDLQSFLEKQFKN